VLCEELKLFCLLAISIGRLNDVDGCFYNIV
jgi:hypothetical protein